MPFARLPAEVASLIGDFIKVDSSAEFAAGELEFAELPVTLDPEQVGHLRFIAAQCVLTSGWGGRAWFLHSQALKLRAQYVLAIRARNAVSGHVQG